MGPLFWRNKTERIRYFGVCFVLAGIVFLILAGRALFLNYEFSGRTAEDTGLIEKLTPAAGRFGPSVVYRYQVGTYVYHELKELSPVNFGTLYQGEWVPIKYLPDDPKSSRIDLPGIRADNESNPSRMATISSLFFAIGLFLVLISRRKQSRTKGVRHKERGRAPGKNPTKEIWVRGWQSEEISKMLDDYRKLGSDDLPDFEEKFDAQKNGAVKVTFPPDLPDSVFPYLVNYLQYPKDFPPKTVLVVGRMVLSKSMSGNPDPRNVGKNALFYVPAEDRKYDVVYIKVEATIYANSFAALTWKKVSDPRFPDGLADLISAHGITV